MLILSKVHLPNLMMTVNTYRKRVIFVSYVFVSCYSNFFFFFGSLCHLFTKKTQKNKKQTMNVPFIEQLEKLVQKQKQVLMERFRIEKAKKRLNQEILLLIEELKQQTNFVEEPKNSQTGKAQTQKENSPPKKRKTPKTKNDLKILNLFDFDIFCDFDNQMKKLKNLFGTVIKRKHVNLLIKHWSFSVCKLFFVFFVFSIFFSGSGNS